jgi:hypothetical protein
MSRQMSVDVRRCPKMSARCRSRLVPAGRIASVDGGFRGVGTSSALLCVECMPMVVGVSGAWALAEHAASVSATSSGGAATAHVRRAVDRRGRRGGGRRLGAGDAAGEPGAVGSGTISGARGNSSRTDARSTRPFRARQPVVSLVRVGSTHRARRLGRARTLGIVSACDRSRSRRSGRVLFDAAVCLSDRDFALPIDRQA